METHEIEYEYYCLECGEIFSALGSCPECDSANIIVYSTEETL